MEGPGQATSSLVGSEGSPDENSGEEALEANGIYGICDVLKSSF